MGTRVLLEDAPAAESELSSQSCVLSLQLIKQFCNLIRRGLPADGACDYLGIPNSTYWSWIRKGEAYTNNHGDPKEHKLYGEFYGAFRRATAEYKLTLVDRLHQGKQGDWYKELAILERRDRRSFGRYEPPGGGDVANDVDEKFI